MLMAQCSCFNNSTVNVNVNATTNSLDMNDATNFITQPTTTRSKDSYNDSVNVITPPSYKQTTLLPARKAPQKFYCEDYDAIVYSTVCQLF